jgi:hypothetical protein
MKMKNLKVIQNTLRRQRTHKLKGRVEKTSKLRMLALVYLSALFRKGHVLQSLGAICLYIAYCNLY